MRFLSQLIILLVPTLCNAQVKTIDGFDGFSWGASLSQIEQKHGDKYKQKENQIEYDYYFDIRFDKKSELETVGGLVVISRIFIFDEKCGLFKSCRLIRGLYILSSKDDVAISPFINTLSRKYGTFLEAESSNYTLGDVSRGFEKTYEKKELYWFANDQTYIKLNYGILIKQWDFQDKTTSKIGDIHHIKLNYSGLADVRFKEEPTKKEIGF